MPTTHTALADLLAPAYGTVTPAQITRYSAALAKFRRIYGPGPVLLLRAPGRVNIIGEHTDYNHGFVLPAALDKDIVILARPRADQTDPTVRAANIEDRFAPTEFTLAPTIPSAERGHWSNYLRGPAQMIAAQARERARGADLLIVGAPPTGVPRAAGLSSSSAVVVAAAITLSHLAELPNASPDFAQACADAEWYVGTRGGIAYCASKHGVVGMTKCAALDFARKKIRVNAVCPGIIQTPMLERMASERDLDLGSYAAQEPVGRLGEPREIGDAVAWLLSDEASFVTGLAMPVDGGYTAL